MTRIKGGKKKELQNKVDTLERQIFLNVYTEFDKWLRSLGFRPATFKESMNPLNYDYWTNGEMKVDSLYGVENYIHDAVNLSLHFLRGRNEHLFYVTGGFMQRSASIELEQFKSDIFKEVKELKEAKLKELNSIPV